MRSSASGPCHGAGLEYAVLCQLNPAIGTDWFLEEEPDPLGTAVLTEDVATLRTLPCRRLQESPDRSSAAKAVPPYQPASSLQCVGEFKQQYPPQKTTQDGLCNRLWYQPTSASVIERRL